mgnify:CR=1 FL=1
MAYKALPSPEALRQLLDYDPETGVLTWRQRPREMFSSDMQWKTWNTRFSGQTATTVKKDTGYRTGGIWGVSYKAHRLIWVIMTGREPASLIDHIIGDKADNRWENLRLTDKSGNGCNRAAPVTNTSGLKGASWDKLQSKWRAQIQHRGKTIYLGLFDTPEAAHAAYASAAHKMHKEFARLA